MADTHQAFLDDIAKSPADSTIKLIFADWLEERGESDLAFAVRWLAARGKWPDKIDVPLDVYNPCVGFAVYELQGDCPGHAWLPPSITGAIIQGDDYHCRSNTVAGSLDILASHLALIRAELILMPSSESR
jgi:uncharacterized protein (TIGR02996 family)